MQQKPITRGVSLAMGILIAGAAIGAGAPERLQDAGEVSTPEAAAESAVSWRALAPAADDVEVGVALAMVDVLEGRARAAAADLEALVTALPEDPAAERARTEKARIERWLALRESFVDYVIGAGTKLSIDYAGEKLVVKVVKRDGDQLTFAENRRKIETLSLEEIPSMEVTQCLAKGSAEHKSSWVRVYPYALAGDPRWSKLLRDQSEEAEAFRTDVEANYPPLLELAGVAAELRALSKIDVPSDLATADATVERIRALVANHGDRELITERHEPLRLLAGAALTTRFDKVGLGGVMHGKVTEVSPTRLRLTYDFKEPEELLDFTEDSEYLASARYGGGVLSDGVKTKVEVKRGAVVGVGSTCFRHPVVFEAPLQVRYRMEFQERKKNPDGPLHFVVGILDDGLGTYAGHFGFGNLRVRDKNTGYEESSWSTEGIPFIWGKVYELEVRQDDKGIITSIMNKQEMKNLDAKTLRSGSIFLWWHTDARIGFHEVEIEGTVTDESLALIGEGWVETQLVKLGLE